MTAKSGLWSKQQRVIPYLIVVITLSLIVILQGLVLWQQKQHSSLEFLLFGLAGIALFNAISLRYLFLPSINYRQLTQAFTRHNNTAIKINSRLTKMPPLTQSGDGELDVLTGERYCSEPLCCILGHDPKQSPPSLEDIFPQILPPEREYWKSLIQRTLSQGYAFSLDHSILYPNGTVRHITSCSESIENQAGKVICLIGTARDITAQKQLEIVLPTSESRLHEILNTAFAAIFSFRVYRDRTWVYDYVSAGVEEIYGYTPAEFIATSTLWMSVIHPDERESVISLLCERFFASQPGQVEFPIKTKEGVTRWLARSTAARRDIDQDCWFVTAVDIDITERKRIEAGRQQVDQEVRQQMTLLRQAIDSIPHHLFIKDDQGHFILANRAAAEVHGTTPEQLIGHRETDFNPYLDAAWLTEITAINQSVMHAQRSQTLPDTQLISHAGETQWYQIHLTPYRGLDHQVRGLIGNALNVTDRKRLDLALQASEVQLSMTLNAAKASIISYRLYRDDRWEYLYISPGCEAILGYTAAAMITDPTLWRSRVVPEDWETVFLPILDDLFGERSLSLEYRFLHRDDEIRWISTGLTSQYDPETDTWVVTLVDIDISDRKRAEMSLQESQRQYQTLVDSVESIVWEADPDTFQFTFVSPQAKRILGYPLAAWLEPNFWTDHVIPDDLEAACAYCQRCIESRQDHRFEYRMIAADGRIVWIQDIVKLVYEGPRLIKLVGLLLDISDRKQAETALWESQQLLERILDSVPQAIFWKDRQSVYLGCNQNFADYAGIRHPAEIVGKTDHELPWRPQDTAYYRQTDREVMTTGAAQLHLVEQQHPADGNAIWVELSKVPLADAADHIVGILGTYEDITQRQTTEAALYYSEARLRAVFEQSTVGIAFMDLAGRFLEVNTAYATITGYSQAELLSMTCSEITHPDDREPCRPQIDQLINNDEQTSLYLEKRYRCKDGHDKWVSLNLSTIRVHHDQTLSFLASIAVDITDRKQTEQALVRQTAQEQAFNRVVQTIRNSLDLNTIFATAVQEAAHFLKIDRVSIVQYQPERQCWQHVMEHRGRDDIPDTTGLEIPDRDNPFAAQLKRFEVVRWDNAQTITDAVNRPIAEKFPGSWLLMPLIVNGQIWGSFSLFKDEPQETFSDYQVELVQRLADQIAIAIQQSTLYSQLQAANQQLQYLATHDSLTKLTNRRYFDEQIIREWSRLIHTVDEAWLSLILCDIDYFKQYNDFYGHLQGDDCLIAVAQALSNGIQRPTDVITRYGGEEFAVILPDTDSTGAIHVVQQIQAVIAALYLPHAASPVATQITLSFGIACAHKTASARLLKTTAQTSDVLIQMADQALYEAKSQGRNRYEISTTRVSSG